MVLQLASYGAIGAAATGWILVCGSNSVVDIFPPISLVSSCNAWVMS